MVAEWRPEHGGGELDVPGSNPVGTWPFTKLSSSGEPCVQLRVHPGLQNRAVDSLIDISGLTDKKKEGKKERWVGGEGRRQGIKS